MKVSRHFKLARFWGEVLKFSDFCIKTRFIFRPFSACIRRMCRWHSHRVYARTAQDFSKVFQNKNKAMYPNYFILLQDLSTHQNNYTNKCQCHHRLCTYIHHCHSWSPILKTNTFGRGQSFQTISQKKRQNRTDFEDRHIDAFSRSNVWWNFQRKLHQVFLKINHLIWTLFWYR